MSKKKILYEKKEMTLEDFKKYISTTYKNKYTIDESTWKDKDTPVMMYCEKHGWFERIPTEFGLGFVCPYEGSSLIINPEWNKRAFFEKCKMKFGNRFEYDTNNYPGCKKEIIVTCKKHGKFKTTPDKHLSRVDGGCRKCFKEHAHNRFVKNEDLFISQSKEIWGEDAFDYSNLNYVNQNEKINLTCKKHNITFKQTAYRHLQHVESCPECIRESNKERNLMETNVFIERATKVHNGRYKYEKTDTKQRDNNGKVLITCPIHGYYWQDPQDHLAGKGCPKCSCLISKPEEEIKNYILSLLPNEEIIQGNRKILNGKEVDLYLPRLQLAIEFNGIHWHTEEFNRDRNYHLNKLICCNKKGIKLIHIFEDEWIEHKEIVLSKIKHKLKINDYTKKIRGHKCIITEISPILSEPFFKSNHIQGYVNGSVMIGAFYENELVGACIFKKENTEGFWELTRMATQDGYLCHGVCGKLFKYFVDKYNPVQVKSFADRRWTLNKDNNIYVTLGFKLSETLKPDYRYVVNNTRMHKFNFRKNRLHKKYGLPLTMTEREMCQELGFYRIWDCGLFKYVWKK